MSGLSRRRRALVVALGASLVLGCRALGGEESSAPPNFVLLMTDDQGWGELGARGHSSLRTPHLDRLAGDGLVFERFYAAHPTCSPTRASFLTGRHPNRTGTFSWGHELPGSERTLAEELTRAGYATGHFGKWHVGSVRPEDATSPGAQGFETWASAPNFFDLDPLLSVEGTVVEHRGEGSDVVTERALAFIERSVADRRPFLAVVWYGNPHLPHVATEDDLASLGHLPEEERAYAAELEAIDRSVGTLRAGLRALGVEDRTLVWFTSDNGPRPPAPFDEEATAGLRGRKGSLWEGGVRVPALVVWPEVVEAGRRTSVVASTSDLLPTVLELAGVELPPVPLDGVSQVPALHGREVPRPRGLGFWALPTGGRVMHARKMLELMRAGERSPEEQPPVVQPDLLRGEPRGAAAWIDGDLKLHADREEGGLRYRLYDLAVDPGESRDLAAERTATVARLASDLAAWRQEVARDWLARHAPSD